MDRQEILKELRARGMSYSLVATALGVSPQHVAQVACRRAQSRRTAIALATAIGRPVADVFPDFPQYAAPRDRERERQEKVLALQRELKRKAA